MISLKVSEIWKKLGTGCKTKEEILDNVTYVKFCISNLILGRPLKYKMEIYSEKDDGISGHKENYLSKTIDNVNEPIDILSQLRNQTGVIKEELEEEIFENVDEIELRISNLTSGGPPRCRFKCIDIEEKYNIKITYDINKAIEIISQLRN